MPEVNLDTIRERTRVAVRQAGAIIREHWDQPREVRHKGRIDLVTATDLAVEQALLASLSEVLPEAGFLAEETAPGTPGLGAGNLDGPTWIVDPLDGTSNFAHGLPFVAVSVGLWRNGRTELGFIFNPILDELFWAQRGLGAFRGKERIHVSEAETLESCMVATGFPYAIHDYAPRLLEWLADALTQCRGVRRFGAAALDLAYLAWGRLDVFYEAALKPWDVAAGWLLVEEAGGRVTPFAADQSYDLFSETLLASNGHVHEAMSQLLITAEARFQARSECNKV